MSVTWSDIQIIAGATAYTPQVAAALRSLEQTLAPSVTQHFIENAPYLTIDAISDTVMGGLIKGAYTLGDHDIAL